VFVFALAFIRCFYIFYSPYYFHVIIWRLINRLTNANGSLSLLSGPFFEYFFLIVIKSSTVLQSFIIRFLKLLFFPLEEESCHEKDTEDDQEHSTYHVAEHVKTENQKKNTDDSEDLFFACRHFPSRSDLASDFFAFGFEYSRFFFERFCECLRFEFYWTSSWRFLKRFSFGWHSTYM